MVFMADIFYSALVILTSWDLLDIAVPSATGKNLLPYTCFTTPLYRYISVSWDFSLLLFFY